ncbi:MAG: chemotaxis protein CheX [Gemmatimonadales bacterium]
MQFLEEEIAQVASVVWDSVLGLHLDRRRELPAGHTRMVAGSVQFTGAWEGAVIIETTAEFARQAAATMFGVEATAATTADTQDAMGELANMTGGNVKSLLPEPCRLSLPTVIEGDDFSTGFPGGELLTTVAFECQGAPLVVRLIKKREQEHAA